MSQIDEIQRTLADYISKDSDFKVKITEDIGKIKTEIEGIRVQTTYTNGSVKNLKAWKEKQENVTALTNGKVIGALMVIGFIWTIASQFIWKYIMQIFFNHIK